MAKYFGKIGFEITSTDDYGVTTSKVRELNYTGDIIGQTNRWETSDKLSDDLTVNGKISVVADSFLYDNIGAMKYVVWMGVKWKIRSIEPLRPRLILTVGGVYNENTI